MVAAPVESGQCALCAGEADTQSSNLAEPAFALGLGDASDQVVADLDQSVAFGGSGQSIGQRTQACSWIQGGY
ncbi:hypothetical protein AB0J57_32345 [Streptomyces sp. NPDC049837]|uniref:hypothetical protein n=1 Tax=Streptomyces sp. NPDC049837 TaxID=3155277 RepID=UPI0034435F98